MKSKNIVLAAVLLAAGYVSVWAQTGGGTITGNTARENGGGVFVEGGTFDKTGGTITGFASDRANGNAVKDASGAARNYRSHAVYATGGSNKVREGTAGPGDSLSYTVNRDRWYTVTGVTAEGAWDN